MANVVARFEIAEAEPYIAAALDDILRSAVPASDSDDAVSAAEACFRALAKISRDRVAHTFWDAFEKVPAIEYAIAAARSMTSVGDDRPFARIWDMVRHPDPDRRRRAVWATPGLAYEGAFAIAQTGWSDEDPKVRDASAEALARFAFLMKSTGGEPVGGAFAVLSAAELCRQYAWTVEFLRNTILYEGDVRCTEAAARALSVLDSKPCWDRACRHADSRVRQEAARQLLLDRTAPARWPRLREFLRDPEPRIRRLAIEGAATAWKDEVYHRLRARRRDGFPRCSMLDEIFGTASEELLRLMDTVRRLREQEPELASFADRLLAAIESSRELGADAEYVPPGAPP